MRSGSSRITPGRRRTRPLASKVLPAVLGIVLVGIVATLGQRFAGSLDWGRRDSKRITFAADQPELGLVYEGLKPAADDALCAGGYEVITPETCTHGPDPAPPGFSVAGDVKPVTDAAAEPVPPERESGDVPSDAEIARDEGGIALTPGAPALVPDPAPGEASFIMGSHDVACEGDGRSGKRVQVLYLHEFGTPSRYTEYVGSIRSWTAGVDASVDASAGETRGSRHVRFVTTPQCRVDVAEVQVPDGSLGSFTGNITALQKLGYNRTDRKYLVFADANVYCGIGTYIADRRPEPGNRNNGGPSYARVDAGCWSTLTATHELVHSLGAVLPGSPNSDGRGQCTDDYDVLCAPDPADTGATAARRICPKKHEQRLDCNHDDYFDTNPKPGSYLTKNWNVARSEFLLSGDGGDDVPEGVPTPPSTGARAPVQAAVEARDATSTSVRLTWSAAAPTSTYEVLVDGDPIARTPSTRARLIGLRPSSRYTVTVRGPKGYSTDTRVQTAPAARPAQDTWFVMTNSLTGGAADLYAARTADGTPVVLNGADGDAQQQWRLEPAEQGASSDAEKSFVLRSRATDKCVAPQDGNPAVGAPLVQVDCTSDGSQRWQVKYTDHGFLLLTVVGRLVVGVGSQRFGAHRVLVLQQADDSRHQNWTALPA